MLKWVAIILITLMNIHIGRLLAAYSGPPRPYMLRTILRKNKAKSFVFFTSGIVGILLFYLADGFPLTLYQALFFSLTILLSNRFHKMTGGAEISVIPKAPSKALPDFKEGEKVLDPLLKTYYVIGQGLTDEKIKEISNKYKAELEEAIIHFKSARDLKIADGEAGRSDATVALHEIGMAYFLLGNLDEARTKLLEARAEKHALYNGPKGNGFSQAHDLGGYDINLGDLERNSGNIVEAKKWYEKSSGWYVLAGDYENAELADKRSNELSEIVEEDTRKDERKDDLQ